MADHKPVDLGWMISRNEYARRPYQTASAHAEEIEDLFMSEYEADREIEDANLEILASAKARNILRRELSLLAIRSVKNVQVAAYTRNSAEASLCDKLERGLRAYDDALIRQSGRDWMRDVAFYCLLRGRGGVQTFYSPVKSGALSIHHRVLDPLQYYPVRSDYGLEWFTRDYYKPRAELIDWFARLEPEYGMPAPTLGQWDLAMPHDTVHVIEYWDERWCAYVIEDEFLGPYEHDYGFVPLVDIQINQTPLTDMRWAFDGTLGTVKDELRHYQTLLSKMATGVELFYYPAIFVRDEDNRLVRVDPTNPGEAVYLPENTQVVEFKPTPAGDVLLMLKNEIEGEIQKGTLPETAMRQDVPDASGFLYSQVISLIQDALADKQHPIQRGYGHVMGQRLRLMEKYAEAQDGGGWGVPVRDDDGRRVYETITAADISGHYDVDVEIKVQQPQAKLQMIAAYKQLRAPDGDGQPTLPFKTAMQVSGLAELVGDVARMEEEREMEWLLLRDEQTQAQYAAFLKAKRGKDISEWEKVALREARRKKAQEQRRALREVEGLATKELTLRPDQWQNPAVLARMAELARQGMSPELALEDGALPLGVPGMANGGNADDPEIANLLALFRGDMPQPMPQGGAPMPGGDAMMQEQPDGFTGYGGIDPGLSSVPDRGALPRQQMDQSGVAQEQIETLMQRGGLPPAR